MSIFKYRDHRGSLSSSVKTVQEFETKEALINYLQSNVDVYGKGKYECEKITIEPYGYDERINWDSHIVELDGFGVFGFTDRQID